MVAFQPNPNLQYFGAILLTATVVHDTTLSQYSIPTLMDGSLGVLLMFLYDDVLSSTICTS